MQALSGARVCRGRLLLRRSFATIRAPPPAGSSVTRKRSRSEALIFRSPATVVRSQSTRPAQYSLPNRTHREMADLAGLDQGERLEQLVQRAEAAREDDEGRGVLHEHRLAHEEEVEVEAAWSTIGVGALLERQLDVAPDREAAGFAGAAVGRLHDAGAAAGDHRECRPSRAGAPSPPRPRSSDRSAGCAPSRRSRRRPSRPPGCRSPRRTRPGSAAPRHGVGMDDADRPLPWAAASRAAARLRSWGAGARRARDGLGVTVHGVSSSIEGAMVVRHVVEVGRHAHVPRPRVGHDPGLRQPCDVARRVMRWAASRWPTARRPSGATSGRRPAPRAARSIRSSVSSMVAAPDLRHAELLENLEPAELGIDRRSGGVPVSSRRASSWSSSRWGSKRNCSRCANQPVAWGAGSALHPGAA